MHYTLVNKSVNTVVFMKRNIKLRSILAASLISLTYFSSAHAVSLFEFILNNNVLANPQYTATQNNQCNQVSLTKSPVNNRSLNPICQLCMGLKNDNVNSAYISLPSAAISQNPSDTSSFSICAVLDTNKTIGSSSFVSDFNLMCSTRGGTTSGAATDTAVVCNLTVGQ